MSKIKIVIGKGIFFFSEIGKNGHMNIFFDIHGFLPFYKRFRGFFVMKILLEYQICEISSWEVGKNTYVNHSWNFLRRKRGCFVIAWTNTMGSKILWNCIWILIKIKIKFQFCFDFEENAISNRRFLEFSWKWVLYLLHV